MTLKIKKTVFKLDLFIYKQNKTLIETYLLKILNFIL